MRWYERKGHEGTQRVQFNEVSTPGRAPSWLPGRKARARKIPEESLRPPKLPSELVSAIRHELHDAERPPRASRPPEPARNALGRDDAHRQSAPPRAESALASELRPPPVELQRMVIDPALTQAFEEALTLLEEERARVLAQTASQLAELATTIARRVIARELSLDPLLVTNLVSEGLESLSNHDRMNVRVGPGFAAACEAVISKFSDAGRRCEVRVDPALGEYGCVVETELGRVDESIESRLATLLHSLRPESEPP